ncbi:MAG: transporter substrate-binding domain-containing protein [Desulfovibrionaceae bacterium]
MMRVVLTVMLAGAVLVMGVSGAHAGRTLRFATEGAYPPFNFVGADGKLTGFDVDIGFALCKAMGVACTVVAVPWDDLIPGLQAGDYDMIVASMAKTAEREKVVDFTDSYYHSRTTFVAGTALKGEPFPQSLRGKILATQRNTVQAAYLVKEFGQIATVTLTEDMGGAFALLAAGKADVVLADSLPAYEFLISANGKGFDFYGEALPVGDIFSSAHIAVRKRDDALRQSIDKALQALRLDGTYDTINRAYFPFSIY